LRNSCAEPLIWDNLHANDYDGAASYCGRMPDGHWNCEASERACSCNPITSSLNYVPFRTWRNFVAARADGPPKAYLSAMREWLPRFATWPAVTLERLILFGDCYYLPYERPGGGRLFEPTGASGNESANWGEETAAFRSRPPVAGVLCCA